MTAEIQEEGSGDTAENRGAEQMYLTALNPACMELLLRFCKAAIISISVESVLNSPPYRRIFILIPIQACGQVTDKALANDFPFGDDIHNH